MSNQGGEGNPPNSDPPESKPPEGGPPAGGPEPKDKAPTREDIDNLKAALNEERKQRKDIEGKFTKLEKEHMSDTEKLIAQAKDEGRREAIQSAGRRLAAAEFKAAAAGKIGDPAAALEVLDLSKFVSDNGDPDTTAIQKVVDRLALAMPVTPAGRVPSGPRSDSEGEPDFIRSALGRGR
jgi:hypothetical protein